DDHGGRHERTAEAEIGRQHKREIGADRIERAMREIDDAAEREDQRQAKRDQEIVDAVKQPVEDLLCQQYGGHGFGPTKEIIGLKSSLRANGSAQSAAR